MFYIQYVNRFFVSFALFIDLELRYLGVSERRDTRSLTHWTRSINLCCFFHVVHAIAYPSLS